MSEDDVQAVRCSACKEEYRFDRDMLSGRFLWFKPKVKRGRGSCDHTAKPEVLCAAADARADRWESLADRLAEQLHWANGVVENEMGSVAEVDEALAAYQAEKWRKS